MLKKVSFIVSCLMVLSMVASAEIIVFQDGLPNDLYPATDTNTTPWNEFAYQGTHDSMVAAGSSYVDFNYGGRDYMSAGNPNYGSTIQQAMLKFDLSALAGATVNSATLEIWSRSLSSYGEQEFSIHEMKPANGGWLEGRGTGSQAIGDEVTFGAKSFSLGGAWAGGYGPLNWANPAYSGGEPVYDMTPIATFLTTDNATTTNYHNYFIDVPASIIQTWVGQDVRDVAGLLIHANFMREFDPEVDPWHYPYTSPSYIRICSGEFATGQYTYIRRPKLTLDYIPIPEPMTLVVLGLGGLLIRRKR